jgi:hypothetical protein
VLFCLRVETTTACAWRTNSVQQPGSPASRRARSGDRPFVNPAGSANDHCASQFFEHAFDSGVLKPGQTFSYLFTTPGEYFYNDCMCGRTSQERW